MNARVQWQKTFIEAPDFWSPQAVEIVASRYLRRAQGEVSIYDLLDRVVSTVIAVAGQELNWAPAEAKRWGRDFYDLLLHQKAAFNSPVYFNVGVFPRFGLAGHGPAYAFDKASHSIQKLDCGYIRPQAAACFIQSVSDSLPSLFSLLNREAQLFKFGSGSGTNFSAVRSEKESLETGAKSSGVMSYLEIFDKAAQAIKSGGTTRRAAKMVILDIDHPDILKFIRWKVGEERKARVLVANGYSSGPDGEAWRTVSGQNSNNSVRVTDAFMTAATTDGNWSLKARTSGEVLETLPAKELLRACAEAAWDCADPGLQFNDTIQRWHACPKAGAIEASNPCSEFMFLNESACNLASINLIKFRDKNTLDWEAFRKTVGQFITAQDLLVDYSSYPSPEIAENSHRFRPLGFGFTNLGGLLMALGLPYDSDAARALAAQVSAEMLIAATDASAELAEKLGPFAAWPENQFDVLAVLEQHYKALPSPEMKARFRQTLKRVEKTGLRNAQLTLIAPTGTIGLMMDCDTLGIEPDFALTKIKKLEGGSELRLVNRQVASALQSLGYDSLAAQKILEFVQANGHAVGAPGLNVKDVSVFDCAMAPKNHPERCISASGHLLMMAAVQPFLSGAISKTVNLPQSATVADVESIFVQAWHLGLKSIAVYRDGSKSLQPLCVDC